ncbi:hypothetical protein C4568_01795 [Candidatus Parcubacteria bacterium]|nr:MAG: hypothetical protein C4568_01795 [Candidatus Parcubacteria bacterium]
MRKIAVFLGVSIAWVPAAAFAANPLYDVNPNAAFSSKEVLVPDGITYTDTVPDTLDLAERANLFITGATRSIMPTMYNAPAGVLLSTQLPKYFIDMFGAYCTTATPCFSVKSGQPNWGNVMLALSEAREMAGGTPADWTVTNQYAMAKNMLDYEKQQDLRVLFNLPNIVAPTAATNPSMEAMQALMQEWEHRPTSALKSTIDEFVQMQQDHMKTVVDPGGKSFVATWDEPTPLNNGDTGYFSTNFDRVYLAADALYAMAKWYRLSGNMQSLTIANQLGEYIRNYNNSEFWRTPDQSMYPQESGQFVGHTHSWLLATLGIVEHALAVEKFNPALSRDELNFADSVYNFMKRRFNVGAIGNFGETGAVGDQIRLGLRLAEAGKGNYYEEIEAWTRNQVAESQIDGAIRPYVENNVNSVYELNAIADKVQGLFFSDAAHILAVPFPNTYSSTLNIDGAANIFHGLYNVWLHTVDINGTTAQVNFLLNKAGKYLDVKSDLPYRGRVAVYTKQHIGTLNVLLVRIPSWTDKSQVTVAVNGAILAAGAWSWGGPYGAYVHISNVNANTVYEIQFPVPVYQTTITQLRDQNQWWIEGSYSDPAYEHIVRLNGTFRGDTLVDASPRPSTGIPRYQRQALAALPAGPVAPPTTQVERFVMDGTASDVLGPSITASPTSVSSGGRALVSWNSPTGSACVYASPTNSPSDLAYGTVGTAGGTAVGPLTQNATFTITCAGHTRTVTISVRTESPVISSITPSLAAPGASVIISGSNFTPTGNQIWCMSGCTYSPDVIPNATNLPSSGSTIVYRVPVVGATPGLYAVAIKNTRGTSNTATFTVTPTSTGQLTIAVSPAQVSLGGRATVSWNAPGAFACVYSSPANAPSDLPYGPVGNTGATGVGPLIESATYTITCNGQSSSATVKVSGASSSAPSHAAVALSSIASQVASALSGFVSFFIGR